MLSNNFSRYTSIIESLEERVLFDGVPDATFLLPSDQADADIPAQVQLEQAEFSAPRELVLIDAGVQNGEQLLSEILANKSDSALEIRFLDGDSNGVEQISNILSSANYKYDAIHIISHGDEGEVSLGNTVLDSNNLNQYADELAGWAEALSADADLLFYGCELVGSEHGEQFIQSISAMTGADVAASDDTTGHTSLGGDWDLEFVVGDVQASSLQASAWLGELGPRFYLSGDGTNVLTVVDPSDTNPATNEEIIGPHVNAVSVEAIARDPFTGELYLSLIHI